MTASSIHRSTSTRRATIALLGLLATGAFHPSADAQDASLRFIGQQILPTGTQFGGTEVGGLSGISYDSVTQSYYTISDDRSQVNPARFYTLNANFNANSFTSVTFTGVTSMRQPNGSTYPALSVDPEAIRFTRSANGTPSLIYTSEGENKPGVRVTNPFVRQMNLDGTFVREFQTPVRFNPTPTSGVRDNLAFESVSVQVGANRVLTGTENALIQDGPASAPGVPSPARLLSYNLTTGAANGQYAYRVGPVSQMPNPTTAFSTNGLVDILPLDDTGNKFLSVERSFSMGATGPGPGNTGYTIDVYEFTLDGATDVTNLDTLQNGGYQFVNKTLILDLTTLGIDLDNIEGVTFGPTLANGDRSLVFVSDNNFATNQFTQFLAFDLQAVPEPSTWGMLGLGAAGMSVVLLRRRRAS